MSTRKRARAMIKDAHELGEVCIVSFREGDNNITDAVGAPALLLRLQIASISHIASCLSYDVRKEYLTAIAGACGAIIDDSPIFARDSS